MRYMPMVSLDVNYFIINYKTTCPKPLAYK